MLYGVEDSSLKVITHGYNPLMETNGFRQMGEFTVIDAADRPDYLNDLSGFSLKKTLKKLERSTKKFVRNPTQKLGRLAGKVALGGITVITETGVLGKDAKKYGKKAETIAAGTMAGAGAGFVTSGFNPAGLIAGGAAGMAKGIDEATKTRRAGDVGKAFYQAAAWGGGAGAAVGATKMVMNAKAASAAKAANISQFAAKSGYATTAAGKTGLLATSAKVAKDIAIVAGAGKLFAPQQPPVPGAEDGTAYEPPVNDITLVVPGTDGGGYVPGGYSGGYSGGGYAGGGSEATVEPFQEAPAAAQKSTVTKVVLAGAGLLMLASLASKPKRVAA